jgi:hypothetical protein
MLYLLALWSKRKPHVCFLLWKRAATNAKVDDLNHAVATEKQARCVTQGAVELEKLANKRKRHGLRRIKAVDPTKGVSEGVRILDKVAKRPLQNGLALIGLYGRSKIRVTEAFNKVMLIHRISLSHALGVWSRRAHGKTRRVSDILHTLGDASYGKMRYGFLAMLQNSHVTHLTTVNKTWSWRTVNLAGSLHNHFETRTETFRKTLTVTRSL